MHDTIYSKHQGSGAIVVARASTISSTSWHKDQTTWDAFVENLRRVHEHDEEVLDRARERQTEEGLRDDLKRHTPVFFLGELVGKGRSAEQVVSRTMLVGDVDGTHTLDELQEKLNGIEHVIYETISSMCTVTTVGRDEYVRHARSGHVGENYNTSTMKNFLHATKGYPREALEGLFDGATTFDFGLDIVGRPNTEIQVEHLPLPRYRIVVPLAKAFVAAEHAEAAALWNRLCLAFFDSRGIRVDECCAELNRAYWVPATTWTEAKPLVEHHKGELLDFEALAKGLPEIEAATNPWWRTKDQQRSRQQNDRQKTRQKNDRTGDHPRGLPRDYKEVLSFIKDVDSRIVWRMVGMAIHDATCGSEKGFEVWGCPPSALTGQIELIA